MVIFDLEWNSGQYERLKLNEILQIGAVKINRLGGPIVDTLNLYIRPKAHKRYSPPVKELPDLELIEHSDLDFPAAAKLFFDWCGEDRTFGTWGTADFAALLQNFQYWKLPMDDLPKHYYNLQAAFAQAVGAKGQIALHYAVEYCGFPDLFDYHNPQNDAFYTALVTWAFDEALLERSQCSPKEVAEGGGLVDLTVHPPRWKGHRCGPYSDEAALLNSRPCRLAPCPVCGHKSRVPSWFTAGEPFHYARFSCPDHGNWFLRLKVWRSGEGQFFGQSEVLDPTEGARILFSAAKKARAFHCQPSRRSVRKRRRGKRRSPKESKAES